MNKKVYTILISANVRGKTKAITISSAWLKSCVAFGCILVVIMSAASLDYVGLLLQTTENKRLKAENTQLRQQFHVVESKVENLENSLERVRSFSKKLRLITNIKDTDRTLSLAVNRREASLGKPGRIPASLNRKNLNTDSLFLQRAPLDRANNEISNTQNRGYASLSIRIDNSVRNTQLTEQSVLSLYETLSERKSLINATPNIKPTRGWLTSHFGYRSDPFTGKPQMHTGLDIAAAPGTLVYAPADGVVSYVAYEPGYGKIVSIDHGFGVVTRYGHNSQTFVEVGQNIKRKDVISAVGTTGRSSGPHLHYEVRVHGIPMDPRNYILDDDLTANSY